MAAIGDQAPVEECRRIGWIRAARGNHGAVGGQAAEPPHPYSLRDHLLVWAPGRVRDPRQYLLLGCTTDTNVGPAAPGIPSPRLCTLERGLSLRGRGSSRSPCGRWLRDRVC